MSLQMLENLPHLPAGWIPAEWDPLTDSWDMGAIQDYSNVIQVSVSPVDAQISPEKKWLHGRRRDPFSLFIRPGFSFRMRHQFMETTSFDVRTRWTAYTVVWLLLYILPTAAVLLQSVPLIIGVENKSMPITGPFIHVLHVICSLLKVRCKVRVAHYGFLKDDFLDGVLGDVYLERAQIGVGALNINPTRAAAFDIIPSSIYRVYQVIIHESNTYAHVDSTFGAFFLLFTPKVWLVLVVSISFGEFVLWGTSYIQTNMRRKLFPNMETASWGLSDPTGQHSTSQEDILGSRETIRERPPYGKVFKSHSLMVIVLSVGHLITSSTISSQLLSIAATGQRKTLPFSSVEDLLDTDYTVYGSLTMKTAFSTDARLAVRKLGERVQIISGIPLDRYEDHVVELLESGRVALIDDSTLLLSNASCHLVTAITGLNPQSVSIFLFRRGSSLRTEFEKAFRVVVETGVLQSDHGYFTRFYQLKRSTTCHQQTKAERQDDHPRTFLTLREVIAFVVVAALGLTAALIAFVFEKLAERFPLFNVFFSIENSHCKN